MKCALCHQYEQLRWTLCFNCLDPKDNPKGEIVRELGQVINKWNSSVNRLSKDIEEYLKSEEQYAKRN